MAEGGKSGRKQSKATSPKQPWEISPIETIAWVLALGMVAFRCLIQESAEYGWQLSFSLADLASTDRATVFTAPGAVTTVWLTLGMLVVFALWAVAWINGGCARPRRTHLGIGLGGLAVAVIVSTAAAAKMPRRSFRSPNWRPPL